MQTQTHVAHAMTVTFIGRLDAFSASMHHAQLDTLVQAGVRHFVLDLAGVEFLDSAGLAVCVRVLKRVQQDDGSVKMVLPELVAARRILYLARFDRIFEIVASSAEPGEENVYV